MLLEVLKKRIKARLPLNHEIKKVQAVKVKKGLLEAIAEILTSVCGLFETLRTEYLCIIEPEMNLEYLYENKLVFFNSITNVPDYYIPLPPNVARKAIETLQENHSLEKFVENRAKKLERKMKRISTIITLSYHTEYLEEYIEEEVTKEELKKAAREIKRAIKVYKELNEYLTELTNKVEEKKSYENTMRLIANARYILW